MTIRGTTHFGHHSPNNQLDDYGPVVYGPFSLFNVAV